MTKIRILLALVVLAATSSLFAQADNVSAVVKEIIGDAEETEVTVPGESGSKEAVVGAKYPAKTTILAGNVVVVIAFEGTYKGAAMTDAVLSVNKGTTMMIDTLAIDQATGAVSSRVGLKGGEVRVKITQTNPALATDMKVATPTATASIVGTGGTVGYNANTGTTITLFSGSMSAVNVNGTTRSIGAGASGGDSPETLAAQALNASSTPNAPLGMNVFEVSVGTLTLAGTGRAPSDANNPSTNPTGANRSVNSGDLNRGGFSGGGTLPSRPGRS